MILFIIKFRFDRHERTIFQFFPDRICRNNRNAQIIHNTPFYRLYTLHFHWRIENNVFSGKVFIHVQLIIAVRLITDQTERLVLVRRNKIKQTSVRKRGSNKNRLIVAKSLMYNAIGITFLFTVYAYVCCSVHNRLIDFPGLDRMDDKLHMRGFM